MSLVQALWSSQLPCCVARMNRTGETRCPRWTAKTCSLADLGCGSNQRKCCTGEKSLLIASGPGEWRGPAFAAFLRLVVTVQFLQS